ncbi:MAG: DUF4252 domain-containing protein [Candidatus Angelobacter sp.]
MNRINRTLISTLVGLLLCWVAAHGYAQDARLQLANLDKLSEKAARVTDVTLDGSMLQFAVNMIEKADDGDEDVAQLKSIVKKLKGIYIKSFEFDEASQYSKADVEAVRSQLTSPRWTKIVQSVDKRHNEHDEIYLLKNGEQVAGVVILVAEARELTVVNIVGDVPMDKIASLERHFAPSRKKSTGSKQKKESSHDEE